MDEARFEGSPIGDLVPIKGYDTRFDEEYDHVAFVAEALPDQVPLEARTWATVADAMHALGRLDDATSQVPNPSLLVRPTLRREAISTSALEGTFTDLEDVLGADVEDPGALTPALREVMNAVMATEFGVEEVTSGRPVSVHLACELQEVLIGGTRTEGPETGRVRTSNVFIGRDDQRVTEARFVPVPPGPLLDDSLRQWESWVNQDDDLHLLVKVALSHYQFETIHPFHDGNGRVGRTLAILQLVAGRALRHPNLALSTWLVENDSAYRDGLAAVSETGAFDPWVRFFSRAVGEQAGRDRARIGRLLDLRDELVQRVRQAGRRGLAVQIADDAIGFPYLRVPETARRYDVSFEAANKAIANLVDAGVFRQVGERSYGRVFAAPEVMVALR